MRGAEQLRWMSQVRNSDLRNKTLGRKTNKSVLSVLGKTLAVAETVTFSRQAQRKYTFSREAQRNLFTFRAKCGEFVFFFAQSAERFFYFFARRAKKILGMFFGAKHREILLLFRAKRYKKKYFFARSAKNFFYFFARSAKKFFGGTISWRNLRESVGWGLTLNKTADEVAR